MLDTASCNISGIPKILLQTSQLVDSVAKLSRRYLEDLRALITISQECIYYHRRLTYSTPQPKTKVKF